MSTNVLWLFISGAGGLKFKSLAGQIGHKVTNGLPLLQQFFEKSVLPGSNDSAMTIPETHYTLWCNTVGKAKI